MKLQKLEQTKLEAENSKVQGMKLVSFLITASQLRKLPLRKLSLLHNGPAIFFNISKMLISIANRISDIERLITN